MEWSLIGKEDPQKPQMFYPVENAEMTLSGGDTVAARCTMVSYRPALSQKLFRYLEAVSSWKKKDNQNNQF